MLRGNILQRRLNSIPTEDLAENYFVVWGCFHLQFLYITMTSSFSLFLPKQKLARTRLVPWIRGQVESCVPYPVFWRPVPSDSLLCVISLSSVLDHSLCMCWTQIWKEDNQCGILGKRKNMLYFWLAFAIESYINKHVIFLMGICCRVLYWQLYLGLFSDWTEHGYKQSG